MKVRARRSTGSLRWPVLTGQPAVDVVGVEERLVEQTFDMVVGGRVVEHERSYPAALHEAGQPELGQVLTHRGRGSAGELGQARQRRLTLQQRPNRP